MDILLILIPLALTLGIVGLGGFVWWMNSDQMDDLDGAAIRILMDEPKKNPPSTDENEGESRGS